MMAMKRQVDEVAATLKVSKPVVIGIAVAATVVVLALIGGISFWLIRRRRNKRTRSNSGNAHGTARMVDEDDFSHLNERSSKVPLIRHEDESQMTELRHSMSRYDENDEHSLLTMPGRAHSDATERSLPPSYSSATRSNHRPASSIGGSGGGLRPLSLVAAHADDDVHPPQTSPERHNHRNRLSIRLPAHGRSRSASRFREEDLDA